VARKKMYRKRKRDSAGSANANLEASKSAGVVAATGGNPAASNNEDSTAVVSNGEWTSKAKSSENVDQMLDLVTKNISPNCLVCDTPIVRNSVLFHCECLVVYCQTCATLQVAAQRDTYNRGLQCPYCRQPSDNIRSISICKSVESGLVERAFQRYRIRTSRNDDGICKALTQCINDNCRGTITLEEIRQADARNEIPPAFRLELARLECLREQQEGKPAASRRGNRGQATSAVAATTTDAGNSGGSAGSGLPLGPLKHLTFTRNVVLEHALDIQRQTRMLWSNFLTSSYDSALSYLTNEAAKIHYQFTVEVNSREMHIEADPDVDDDEDDAMDGEMDGDGDGDIEDDADDSDEDYVEEMHGDGSESGNKSRGRSIRESRSRRTSFDPMFAYYGSSSSTSKVGSEQAITDSINSSGVGGRRSKSSDDGLEKGGSSGVWPDAANSFSDSPRPNLHVGSSVKVNSGNFAGLVGTVVSFTTGGDSVRVEFIDSNGTPRRTTVMHKNVTLFDDSTPNDHNADARSRMSGKSLLSPRTNSDTASTVSTASNAISDEKAHLSKRFCICQTPYCPPYIQCLSGKGICNGLVHPGCFVELDGKTEDELNAIEQNGFICSSCVEVLSLRESEQNPNPTLPAGSSNSFAGSSISSKHLSAYQSSSSSSSVSQPQFAVPRMSTFSDGSYQRQDYGPVPPSQLLQQQALNRAPQPNSSQTGKRLPDPSKESSSNSSVRYGTYPSYYNVSSHPQLRFDPYAHPVSAGYVSSLLHNSLQTLAPENPTDGQSSPASQSQSPQMLQSNSMQQSHFGSGDFAGSMFHPKDDSQVAGAPYMVSVPQRPNSSVYGRANPQALYPGGLSPDPGHAVNPSSNYAAYAPAGPYGNMPPSLQYPVSQSSAPRNDLYPNYSEVEAIDPRSQFVQKQPKKITSCDVQVIRWMISTANVFPVLVNRPINNREVRNTYLL
jgi:hypothetical protein